MTPGEFYAQLLKFALETPFSVTSGYRTKTHNHEVGGVPWSHHLYGMALDLVFDRWEDVGRFTTRVEKLHPNWDVVPFEDKGYVHVEAV